MSPLKVWPPLPPRARAVLSRIQTSLGAEVHAERTRRGWTLEALAERAGVSKSMVQRVEVGDASSIEGYVRIAVALGLEPRFTLLSERAAAAARAADPVHAAMGEVEAAHLRAWSEIRLDEPYQHYQFAGRADLIAVAPERRALLHIENRTRFPDIQGFAGAFNAKRAYLAPDIADRFGVRGGFASVTHVIVALWSAEVLHALRLRTATFSSIAPDAPDPFAAWWAGMPPTAGTATTLVVFDPLPGVRRSRRRWIGLADVAGVDPRYRDYAAALGALRREGLA